MNGAPRRPPRPAGAGGDSGLPEALLRDALFGAGMSVWEWQVRTDRLSNVDTSAALLGYAAGEIASNQDAWNQVIHPDDREANDNAFWRHARGEAEIYEHEYRARAKDGRWHWISERGRIVERDADGRPLRVVGTLADVSARHEAQQRALESAERLVRIARHVPGVVFQFERRADGTSRFPWVSDSCVELVGLTPAELMRDATAFILLVPEGERKAVLQSIADSAASGRPWRCSWRIVREDGTARWITGSATPMPPGADGSVLWHGYLEDTTDLQELERARRAAAEAEAASAAKTAFLSRLSHELRTPLNAVLGFAQLLELEKDPPLSPGQARRVALIRDAGQHLLEMIGDLLDLTRVEAGRIDLQLADVAPAALLAEVVELLTPQAAAAGVRVALDTAAGAPTLRADRTRLRQVLLNLLANAIKYNRRGGWVRLGCRGAGDRVVFEVADGGIGIAAEHLPKLFSPFERLAQAGGPIEGAGIGLAVSRRLVEAMQGTIEVASRLGEGTTFWVALPAA